MALFQPPRIMSNKRKKNSALKIFCRFRGKKSFDVIFVGQKSGFVALISAVIISAILMALAYSLSLSGMFTRFNVLDSENKKVSAALARSCLDTALLKIKQDSGYAGGESFSQSLGSCSVCPIQNGGNIITIDARSAVGDAHTNLEMKINSADYSKVSLEELATYPRSDCAF